MLKEYFLKVGHHWKVLLKDRTYLVSLIMGLLVFAGSFALTYFASAYNDGIAYAPVGDFILDGLPTYNLEFLFIWGFYALVSAIFVYCVFVRPELAPFTLKTYGILLAVRACFITLTHIGPPAGFFYESIATSLESPFRDMIFRNDLFFSGHTAAPFLGFLLFRDTKFKWFMLGGSLVMGGTVLLMHVHYSIDVFAAFFITHGIYAVSDKVFNNLNLRFAKRLKVFAWKRSVQEKYRDLRDNRRLKRDIKLGDKVEGDVVFVPEED